MEYKRKIGVPVNCMDTSMIIMYNYGKQQAVRMLLD